jgi:hypothetical protein
VYGDWLPRTTFGSMYLFWAIVRGLWLAAAVLLLHTWRRREPLDVLIVDQLSYTVPFLRLTRAKVRARTYPHKRKGAPPLPLPRRPAWSYVRPLTDVVMSVGGGLCRSSSTATFQTSC